MKRSPIVRHAARAAALLAVAVILAGCQGSTSESEKPADEPAAPTEPAQPRAEPVLDPEPEPLDEPPPEITRTAGPMVEPIPVPEILPPAGLHLPGEPGVEQPPATEPAPGPDETDLILVPVPSPTEPEDSPPQPEEAQKAPDLEAVLAEEVKGLKRLHPTKPVWLDHPNKRVVVLGRVCQRQAPLEMFACLAGTKEHESIVSADIEAYTVHTALLALDANAGHPATWNPEYSPATGAKVDITVVWKDDAGVRKTARAQDWILDVRTKQAMTYNWVFAGSRFWVDEETGKRYYQAEGGDFICVSNFPSAMLDLPIQSSESNDALLFRAFTERIPPLGTPVALVLTPELEKKSP